MVAWDTLVIDNDIYSSPIGKLIGFQHDRESDPERKEITRSMWQAFKLMERCGKFLMENRTTSMVEYEVVPLQVASKFLTDGKLQDEETHMVSADLDRWAAELSQGNKDLLETAPSEKKCSSASSTLVST
ncbi:uncharacterized protein LOC141655987 [Silene latifolia]|uniref:uncharacterized protein LOC141655987 n=1 Tax=Silene latifolia TaxID=37657 RepID=UPI003D7813C4